MRKTKMEKGITLIALIITIVVLLILAVVAINSITNDGLLGKAENAASEYNQSVKNEQDILDYYEGYLSGTLGQWQQDGTTVTKKNADGTVLTTSNSIDVTSNSYYYYPNTLTTSSSGTTKGIETTSDAYKVLFKQADGTTNDNYWLASQYQGAGSGLALFGLRYVVDGFVSYCNSWFSSDGAGGDSLGIRAVVCLKSEVNISSSGVIS